MGAMWELFKIGIAFLAVGFVLSVLGIPLGLHFGRIGVLLVGGSILLPILGVAVVLVVAGAASSSSTQPHRRQRRPPGRAPADRRRPHRPPNSHPDTPPPTGGDQLDLDVETIDDYRQ